MPALGAEGREELAHPDRQPAFDLRRLTVHPTPSGLPPVRSAGSPPVDPGRGLETLKVRVRTGDRAAALAAREDAEAFTAGSEIVFGAGRFRPESAAGRRLLFHELAHVAQQHLPGRPAPETALEAEADRAAGDGARGRAPRIRLSAPHGRRQRQPASWTAGDVLLDPVAANQVQTKGGLFSGGDQAHVNVSSRGRLAYDSAHTAPEDPFRWSRLRDIVDAAHLKITAVSDQAKFKVKEAPKAPPVDRSIADIRLLVGDLSVMGITLDAGGRSPDPVYDQIYYDQNQGLGALSHELFGHEWLATKGAPSVHPPAGSAEEKAKGTLLPGHQITDPFGNVFSGTVRAYIAKHVESLGTNVTVTASSGQSLSVPKSPTQKVGVGFVNQAFADLHSKATGGLTKSTYTAAMAQAWKELCDNYDLMPTNAEARQAGNSNLTYTKEVVLSISYLLFDTWTPDQKSGFRILLADYALGRSGFRINELSTKLEAAVGSAPSPFKPSGPTLP